MAQKYACKELCECKLQEVLTEKERQHLRANNHELRQLERQLQSAVVSKQLMEQQQDISRRQEENLRAKNEENAKFAVKCELIRKSFHHQEEQERQKKKLLLQSLKCQVNDMQQKRRIEFQEVKKDCEEIEKLLKQIEAEKIAKRKEAELIRETCKKDMEESYRNVKFKQQLEKEKDFCDYERNLAFQKECDNLKFQMAEAMKKVQREKEALSERIGQQLATQNQEKQKRENLFLSLLVEERKAKDDKRYKETLVKRINEREKLRVDRETIREEIRIQKERELKDEEEKFREEHMRYLEERDKIDQLSNEKRRRKKMEHSKALREMIELRRCQKANVIAAEIAEFEKIKHDEKQRDKLIEAERNRMLNAVPKEILKYLPPGVLRSPNQTFLTLPGQNT